MLESVDRMPGQYDSLLLFESISNHFQRRMIFFQYARCNASTLWMFKSKIVSSPSKSSPEYSIISINTSFAICDFSILADDVLRN